MDFDGLHAALPQWLAQMDHRLQHLFADDHPTLRQAGTSVLTASGKRIRPTVLFCTAAAFGPVTARAVDYAAILELVHTASLIHDDVVDEAELRRAVPSAPARWGNKFAVLLGDYLVARVFELVVADSDIPIKRALSDAALAMSRGATLEVSSLHLDASIETYWQVVDGKTAALFSAAAFIGARLGGADPEQQERMRRLGLAFGRAFQLADDLLDLQEDGGRAGKPAGADLRQQRATLPILHAVQQSPATAAEIRALWEREPFDAGHLIALRRLIAAAGGFAQGWRTVQEYQADAMRCLADAPSGDGLTALQALCTTQFPLPVLPIALSHP